MTSSYFFLRARGGRLGRCGGLSGQINERTIMPRMTTKATTATGAQMDKKPRGTSGIGLEDTVNVHAGPPPDVRLIEQAADSTCCLRFIDPWGDTTFNQQQIETLFDELSRLSANAKVTEGVRAQARALADFVGGTRGALHTYVKFIGD